jgi:hypothetical protein
VADNYTHTYTADERNAGKLGDFLGRGWPEIDKVKVISFPNLSQKEEGLPIGCSEALAKSVRMVAGVRFELTTFGL